MLDYREQFENVKNSIVKSVSELFPHKGNQKTLIANRVWVDDNLREDDFAGQKSAKNNNRTWAVPVYADLSLKDNETGKILDKSKKIKIASLPKMTPRGSFIVDGTEYQVNSQLRLKPGVYTRIKDNGELESVVNLSKGKNFKIHLNPKTGIFYINVGTTNARLYHLLIALGYSKGQIKDAWGDELAEQNDSGNYDTEISKVYRAYYGKSVGSTSEAMAGIEEQFAKTKIRKDTTQLTLGKAFTSVDKSLLLETSRRFLAFQEVRKLPMIETH